MVCEAEEFATEDETQCKRIEAMNALFNCVYGIKAQLTSALLVGKLEDDSKKEILQGDDGLCRV